MGSRRRFGHCEEASESIVARAEGAFKFDDHYKAILLAHEKLYSLIRATRITSTKPHVAISLANPGKRIRLRHSHASLFHVRKDAAHTGHHLSSIGLNMPAAVRLLSGAVCLDMKQSICRSDPIETSAMPMELPMMTFFGLSCFHGHLTLDSMPIDNPSAPRGSAITSRAANVMHIRPSEMSMD